jgi:hypothetical protein
MTREVDVRTGESMQLTLEVRAAEAATRDALRTNERAEKTVTEVETALQKSKEDTTAANMRIADLLDTIDSLTGRLRTANSAHAKASEAATSARTVSERNRYVLRLSFSFFFVSLIERTRSQRAQQVVEEMKRSNVFVARTFFFFTLCPHASSFILAHSFNIHLFISARATAVW